jgi:shikimate kinase
MGAGKSSVGRWLERRTGLPRIDTDEIIASKFGLSIPEIFSRHGEGRFRDAETEVLSALVPERPSIIVTGGGIVVRPENVTIMKRLGTIVWLAGDEKKLFERAPADRFDRC